MRPQKTKKKSTLSDSPGSIRDIGDNKLKTFCRVLRILIIWIYNIIVYINYIKYFDKYKIIFG